MKNLRNKNCLITGSAAGIGRSLALGLAGEGMNIFLADINLENLKKVEKEIQNLGVKVCIGICDISNNDDFKRIANEAHEKLGDLDMVINNAGINGNAGSLEMLTFKYDWEKIININIWGNIYSLYTFLPRMLKRGSGHIVNVASVAGTIGEPYNIPYVTTKFAVVGFSEALYSELNRKGINVSIICPSAIKTSLMHKINYKFSDEMLKANQVNNFDQAARAEFQKRIEQLYNRSALSPDKAAGRYIKGIKKEKLYIYDKKVYQFVFVIKGISATIYKVLLRMIGDIYMKMIGKILHGICYY